MEQGLVKTGVALPAEFRVGRGVRAVRFPGALRGTRSSRDWSGGIVRVSGLA